MNNGQSLRPKNPSGVGAGPAGRKTEFGIRPLHRYGLTLGATTINFSSKSVFPKPSVIQGVAHELHITP